MKLDKIKLQQQIVAALKKVYDPELPVNIYDLGLIYDISVEADGTAVIIMTFTSPNCPATESLPDEIKVAIKYLPGITKVQINITFDPPWNASSLSEEIKMDLGLI